MNVLISSTSKLKIPPKALRRLYKEIERLLGETESSITAQRAVELTHTMCVIVDLPNDPEP